MLLPLIVAIAALVPALMAAGLLSHVVSIPSAGPTLGILIGLGVGIDYALFIVTRHRNNLKAGMSPKDAAVRALNTSGRAVLFAGTTVCIALLGMLVLRIGYISGLGIAAAVTVVFTVAAATTLLPALLGFLGPRVLSRKERRRLAANGPAPDGTSGCWTRLAAFVQRHPAPLAAAAAIVMLDPGYPGTLAAAGILRRGQRPRRHHHPQGLRTARHRIRPRLQRPPATSRHDQLPRQHRRVHPAGRHPQDRARHRRRRRARPRPRRLADQRDPHHLPRSQSHQHPDQPVARQRHPRRRTRHHTPCLRRRGHRDQRRLRHRHRPQAAGLHRSHPRPRFPAAHAGLPQPADPRGRSGDEPARRRRLLRRTVAIFEYGWGLRLLNLGQPGPIESFLPVLMLAVLFGLSMDYEVFLVSRIREEWAATGDNHQAVRTGQATTGRVIIAAATIMILVFSAFILSGQQTIGEIGIGLAAAVLLDAFLLRTLLVPALMQLSGRGNWWLPGWLDRILPHLSIEPATGPPALPTPAPGSELTRSTTAR